MRQVPAANSTRITVLASLLLPIAMGASTPTCGETSPPKLLLLLYQQRSRRYHRQLPCSRRTNRLIETRICRARRRALVGMMSPPPALLSALRLHLRSLPQRQQPMRASSTVHPRQDSTPLLLLLLHTRKIPVTCSPSSCSPCPWSACVSPRNSGAPAPGMEIQVNEAARRLSESQSPALRKAEVGGKGVLRALEDTPVMERLGDVAAGAFAREVFEDEAAAEIEKKSVESEQVLVLVLAGAHKFGGRVGALATQVACVLGGGDFNLNADLYGADSEEEEDGSAEDDVEKLLRAIVLHRHVFFSPSAFSFDKSAHYAAHAAACSGAVPVEL
ncbi:hypothetical protein C8R45DRAFT_516505 [Mycena sanguinolenta]|nr:hypothetical protein C8R45DRAFT_516505 [Mycena sanguinolenta]